MEGDWSHCIQTLYGHESPVHTVRFSHNGKHIASATWDRVIKIWDSDNGECCETIEYHSDMSGSVPFVTFVACVAFSFDDKQVTSVSDAGLVQVWNVSNGTCIKTIESEDEVCIVALSEDAQQVALGLKANKVKVRSLSKGRSVQVLKGHETRIRSLAFSMDGKRIASSSLNEIKIWNTGSGECVSTFVGSSADVIALSPDNQRMAYYNDPADDYKIIIRNFSGSPNDQEERGHSGSIFSLAFSNDNKMLVSGSEDGTVRTWGEKMGNRKLGGHRSLVNSVAISPDCEKIVSASRDGTLKTWAVSRNTYKSNPDIQDASITSVVLSGDGKLFASGYENGSIKIWDRQSGLFLFSINDRIQDVDSNNSPVDDLVFSHDGEWVVSSYSDTRIEIWSTKNRSLLRLFRNEQGLRKTNFHCVALSQDRKQIASAWFLRTVSLWDTETGALLKSLETDGRVTAIIFSYDGKRIAAAQEFDCQLNIWETSSGACLWRLRDNSYQDFGSIAFAFNGKLAVGGRLMDAEKRLLILDVDRKVISNTLKADSFQNLSFDDTGSHLTTRAGILDLDILSAPTIMSSVLQPHKNGLSANSDWIMWDNRRAVWLPMEYRPVFNFQREVFLNTSGLLIIACQSNRLLTMRFSEYDFPYGNSS